MRIYVNPKPRKYKPLTKKRARYMRYQNMQALVIILTILGVAGYLVR